jgi:hypothetical protein
VETLEEVAFLRAHHCDEAQGYYFSRPVLPQQFANLLETGILEKIAPRAVVQILSDRDRTTRTRARAPGVVG